MRSLRWYYIISSIFSMMSLITVSACNGIPTPAEGLPVITDFYADPEEAMANEDAVLHWNVSDASTVTIEPDVGDVALSGERSVHPLEITTYTLTATNEVGSVTASAVVYSTGMLSGTVEMPPSPPPTEMIELSYLPVAPEAPELPESPEMEGIVLLDPETQEPTLRLIEEPVSLEPQEMGPILERLEELPSIEIPEVPPIIRRFEAVPDPGFNEDGGYVRLFFDVPNAIIIYYTWSSVEGSGGGEWLLSRFGYTPHVWMQRATAESEWELFFYRGVPHTTTFTLHAGNWAGWSNESITVYVGQQTLGPILEPAVIPTIYSFEADPGIITAGDLSRLSWEVSNADNVMVSSEDQIIRGLPLFGSIHVSPTETTLYQLTAFNTAGYRAWGVRVIVEELQIPTIHSFEADPRTITAGDLSRLSWEVSNADNVEVYYEYLGTGYLTTELPLSGSLWMAPTVTTSYQLTAINTAGEISEEVTITVEGSTPTIHSFEADPATIVAGSSSELSWEVSNADTITITAISLETTVSSVGSMSVSPSTTTTYSLTASNSYGTVTRIVIVTVEPETPPPKAKPDLVITDIWRLGTTQWYYTIKNQGKVECEGSMSELMVDGKAKVEQNIGPLAAGESREMFFTYKFACESGTSYTWSVVADTKSTIDESDENNNSRKEKFTCLK